MENPRKRKFETIEMKSPESEAFWDSPFCKKAMIIFGLLECRFHLDEKKPSRKKDCVERFEEKFTSIVSDDFLKTLSKEQADFFRFLLPFLKYWIIDSKKYYSKD